MTMQFCNALEAILYLNRRLATEIKPVRQQAALGDFAAGIENIFSLRCHLPVSVQLFNEDKIKLAITLLN